MTIQIAEGIDTGREYPWMRTDGWDWPTPSGEKERRWWEVTLEFNGLNGAGGAWVIERWRWNRSDQVMVEQPLTLSYQETERRIEAIRLIREEAERRGIQ